MRLPADMSDHLVNKACARPYCTVETKWKGTCCSSGILQAADSPSCMPHACTDGRKTNVFFLLQAFQLIVQQVC